jgi:hypothetical protein
MVYLHCDCKLSHLVPSHVALLLVCHRNQLKQKLEAEMAAELAKASFKVS